MPRDFRGRNLLIDRVLISGTDEACSLRVHVQFATDDGVVMAHTTHDLAFPMEKEPELSSTVRNLILQLQSALLSLHFADAPHPTHAAAFSPPQGAKPHGIAESLSDDDDTTDDLGGPG